ncbi:MAG: DUF853 domain-containing protein [Thermoguttaceae bacterium]|nr:DUF853 domain-containing protein [Thermoguttaceae bacterium]
MFTEDKILVGVTAEGKRLFLNPRMANRHGLIAGATGTGKTVTLKVLAESFSDMGVPVFLADVKGDVSGMCQPGDATEKMTQRLTQLGVSNFKFHECPVRFWDVYAKHGIPVRTTISEMGPMLLSRLLELTQVQEGVLNLVFKIADDEGKYLIDWKDLRSMLIYIGNKNQEYTLKYGNITKQSVGAIQRALLQVETAGGEMFFGEPDLQLEDWIQCTSDGRGYVNILHAVELYRKPVLYATFLLWMLGELFERLPETGDLDKPKMVFFFDEAHLLFTDAPKVLVQKVEQVVRLIRSKGVGVFFISQKPSDIPDSVLAQLGNRIQHALRAYTPAEQKSLKSAASSFRKNPAFDTETAISELGTGEAVVSFLDEKGRPEIVEMAKILPPATYLGEADEKLRMELTRNNPFYRRYSQTVDRYSAYEMIGSESDPDAVEEARHQEEMRRVKPTQQDYDYDYEPAPRPRIPSGQRQMPQMPQMPRTKQTPAPRQTPAPQQAPAKRGRPKKTTSEKVTDSVIRTLGKCLERTLLGILKKK